MTNFPKKLPLREPKKDLIDQTLKVWQPRSASKLTREDARQIIENVVGFFGVLQEWEAAEKLTLKNRVVASIQNFGQEKVPL